MRDDAPSRTAAWVAAGRQLGMLLPDNVRLVEDHYGAAFSSPALASLIERQGLRAAANVPGIRSWILYMQVRTRVIDDALRAFVAGGGRQLVLLGAGYDCRPLRIPELAETSVFEVDHPATQGHKRSVLGTLGALSPSHYVTWDFEARPMEDLPEALEQAGLDATAPTFTIWEGVTMYLSEPAIDASLRAIRTWSAAGSRLAMTYFAKSRIVKPSLMTRAIKAVVAQIGEPWRFGWTPEELPAYLGERGFSLVSDLALADAARELLPRELAVHVGHPDRRFALSAAAESIAVAR
ncbi:MAG: SAM-dependent methyltransferase [Myxococcales bacterium]|nr:SAM-dependent methyltransferase [Myxococcales bacterium]